MPSSKATTTSELASHSSSTSSSKVVVREIPLFVKLTEEREQKIDALLKLYETKYGSLKDMFIVKKFAFMAFADRPTKWNNIRLGAYVFLVARQWNVDKAFEMMKVVYEYRKNNHIDDYVIFPSSFPIRGYDEERIVNIFSLDRKPENGRIDHICAAVHECLSATLHYWDKDGLPVLYLILGTVDEPGLLKRLKQLANIGQGPEDVLWEYVKYATSVGEILGLYQQYRIEHEELLSEGIDKKNGLVRSLTIVVDVKGLSYKMLWKPAIDLFVHAMSQIFAHYPDCVHRFALVNCPTMIMFAYNIVKGVFTEDMQHKVSFYRPHETYAALSQFINPKYIPTFLGGECSCENGCINNYDHTNRHKHHSSHEHNNEVVGDVITEDIKLRAGKQCEKVFHLKQGDKVIWEYMAENAKEVTFTIYYVPVSAKLCRDEKSLSVKECKPYMIKQVMENKGSDNYQAAEDGMLVLTWDNKSSWIRSKAIQLRVYKEGSSEANSHVSQLNKSSLVSSHTISTFHDDSQITTNINNSCTIHECGLENGVLQPYATIESQSQYNNYEDKVQKLKTHAKILTFDEILKYMNDYITC